MTNNAQQRLTDVYLFAVEHVRKRSFWWRLRAFFMSPISWAIAAAQRLFGGRTVKKYADIIHVGLARGELLDPLGMVVVESTAKDGVAETTLVDAVSRYDPAFYNVFLVNAQNFVVADGMWNAALTFVGRGYDVLGAIRSGVDGLESLGIGDGGDNANTLFCSETIVQAAIMGALNRVTAKEWVALFFFDPTKPEERTPADVCSWPLWAWGAKVNAHTLVARLSSAPIRHEKPRR